MRLKSCIVFSSSLLVVCSCLTLEETITARVLLRNPNRFRFGRPAILHVDSNLEIGRSKKDAIIRNDESENATVSSLEEALHWLAATPMSPRRTIQLLPGDKHVLTNPLTMDHRHGNVTWKVVAAAERNKERPAETANIAIPSARIHGGHRMDPSLFRPWKGHKSIWVAHIDASIGDLGTLQRGSLSGCVNDKAQLYFDGQPLTLARYPNQNHDWNRIQNVTDNNATTATYSFVFAGDRPIAKGYDKAPDLWLHGYWKHDWAENYVKVASIDEHSHTFRIDNTTTPLYELKIGARYRVVNILQELDVPGEYYIDRRRRLLYLYPPFSVLDETSDIILSTVKTLVQATNVSDISFENIDFAIARGTAISMISVRRVSIRGGSVTNVGGDYAIRLWEGTNSTIDGLRIEGCDCGGVALAGGNRHTLQPSGNLVTNNDISNYANWKRTYTPGIYYEGCGHVLSHNKIHHAPHEGIAGHGNDVLVHHNALDTLCYDTSDCGAFYAGRSFSERGNIVSDNLFSNIRCTAKNLTLPFAHVNAIYLDDEMSGFWLVNNTFVDSDRGIFVGGGRDNRALNNTFINTDLPFHVDNRGMRVNPYCIPGGRFEKDLQTWRYQQSPWSDRYPEVVNTFQDRPCTPTHNVISGVRFCGSVDDNWIETSSGTSVASLLVWDNAFSYIQQDDSLCNATTSLIFGLSSIA